MSEKCHIIPIRLNLYDGIKLNREDYVVATEITCVLIIYNPEWKYTE